MRGNGIADRERPVFMGMFDGCKSFVCQGTSSEKVSCAIRFTSCYKNNTMPRQTHSGLSMRERQIMDILYRRGRATANEVMSDLPDSPTYSTVRTQLRVLEEKGHVQHTEQDLKYVYEPCVSRREVRHSALTHVVNTFFEGSVQKVVAALIGREGGRISTEELDRIAELVEKARKGGRK